MTIAGFAENQDFGLGGNNMSEGDKNGLIFGSLGCNPPAFFLHSPDKHIVFFALFMSGYLLT